MYVCMHKRKAWLSKWMLGCLWEEETLLGDGFCFSIWPPKWQDHFFAVFWLPCCPDQWSFSWTRSSLGDKLSWELPFGNPLKISQHFPIYSQEPNCDTNFSLGLPASLHLALMGCENSTWQARPQPQQNMFKNRSH
jgi:hypothetical protein